jgi:hypothetical protein
VRVYSPVDIHIYDEKGNHTGLVDAETSEQTLEDHETEIPLSLYDGFGRTKQIILPFGQEYEIILDGTGDGVFTLETEVLEGDRVVASATFSELSVTSVLNAELQISTTTTAFASTTMLYIDSDGDGVSEAVHESDETLEIQKKDRKNPKKAKKNIKRVI